WDAALLGGRRWAAGRDSAGRGWGRAAWRVRRDRRRVGSGEEHAAPSARSPRRSDERRHLVGWVAVRRPRRPGRGGTQEPEARVCVSVSSFAARVLGFGKRHDAAAHWRRGTAEGPLARRRSAV